MPGKWLFQASRDASMTSAEASNRPAAPGPAHFAAPVPRDAGAAAGYESPDPIFATHSRKDHP
jgi:hypothetical protein